MAETITLQGVTYQVVVNGTLAHGNFVERHVLLSGIRRALIRRDGESDEDFADRITADCLLNPEMPLVLGAILMPEGEDPRAWSPELAHQQAAMIAGLTEQEDKDQIRAMAASLIAGFFVRGRPSSTSSAPSSEAAETPTTPRP